MLGQRSYSLSPPPWNMSGALLTLPFHSSMYCPVCFEILFSIMPYYFRIFCVVLFGNSVQLPTPLLLFPPPIAHRESYFFGSQQCEAAAIEYLNGTEVTDLRRVLSKAEPSDRIAQPSRNSRKLPVVWIIRCCSSPITCSSWGGFTCRHFFMTYSAVLRPSMWCRTIC